MAYLNANIPVTYAQIRKEYLYDLKLTKWTMNVDQIGVQLNEDKLWLT